MLRNVFQLLTRPLRDCFQSVDKLFEDWVTVTSADAAAEAPYKIEPPSQTTHGVPRSISVAEADSIIRNTDNTPHASAESLWRIYGYGSFRRGVTLHLTHFSVKSGGRASAYDAKTQEFLGYCTVHALMDLLSRAEREEMSSVPNPNHAYISRAIDELMKLETWEGFQKEKGGAGHKTHTADVLQFRRDYPA